MPMRPTRRCRLDAAAGRGLGRRHAALPPQVQAERMTSRDAALNLGLETIEVVAKRLHPERSDPLLQFTVPEALAVIERASTNLRDFLVELLSAGRPHHRGAAHVALSLARRAAAGREGL